MPTLNLRGGKKIHIDKVTADKIAEMKWGRNGGKPTANSHDMIEFDKIGKFEVYDVRSIINEDKEDYKMLENNERYYEYINICQQRREQVQKWTPLQKAERMLKTYCYLLYRAKGNQGQAETVMFQDPLYSKLIKPLMAYFEKKPDMVNAPKEVYEELMPNQSISMPSIDGWKTFQNQ